MRLQRSHACGTLCNSNLFYVPLQSYPTHNNYSINTLSHISQSCYNYNPPLSTCTTIFVIILNCKNVLIFPMICLFPLQVLDKLDLKVLESCIFPELDLLDWCLNCCIKHSHIPLRTYIFCYLKRKTEIYWISSLQCWISSSGFHLVLREIPSRTYQTMFLE